MKLLIYVLLTIAVPLHGQLVFTFESKDLSEWKQSPGERWEASAENALSGTYSLHHFFDNPAAGTDYISRNFEYPDLSDTLVFSFMVRHAYNPSSGNNWQVFLLASGDAGAEPGSAAHSAILAGVNYDCSDDLLKIWQLHEGQVFEISSSVFNYQERIGTSAAARFDIRRTPAGRWELSYVDSEHTSGPEMIGSGLELALPTGKYSGIRYSYSSAQDRKLWIDDFIVDGDFFRDSLPPGILAADVVGLNALQLEFTENIEFPLARDITWDKLHPDSISLEGSKLTLFFGDPFPNRSVQQLKISGIADQEGNVMQDSMVEFMQNLAEFGDLVINELMPDPEPVVYLPPCEYIEVWNRSQFSLFLDGWSLSINDREYRLGEKVVGPGDYLLFTSETCMNAYPGVECLALLGTSSALPNGGADIQMHDPYGRLIHRVEYREAAYYGTTGSEGGWSLERTDPENLCGGTENWNISNGWKGGSPGTINSIFTTVPDHEAPILSYIGMPDSSGVSLMFNEALMISGQTGTDFYVRESPVHPAYPPGTFVGASISLTSGEIFSPGQDYEISISGARDCKGNESMDIRRTIQMPQMPGRGMVLLTEVMYDAVAGGSEYFEFMNISEYFIDLQDLKVGISDPGYPIESGQFLSDDSHLVEPGGIVVFCRNSRSLSAEWNLDMEISIVELPGWKSLPNSSSCITLQDRSGRLLDQLCYHDSIHSDLLGNPSGVALERISDAPCPMVSSCWTSASSSVNYGTPGTENSQWVASTVAVDKPVLSSRVFSPDQDGYEDILEILLPASSEPSLVEISICDLEGVLIRKLVDRAFSGQGDRYFWKGEDEDGHVVIPGIYVILIRISTARSTKFYREACAVRYRGSR